MENVRNSEKSKNNNQKSKKKRRKKKFFLQFFFSIWFIFSFFSKKFARKKLKPNKKIGPGARTLLQSFSWRGEMRGEIALFLPCLVLFLPCCLVLKVLFLHFSSFFANNLKILQTNRL